MKDWFDSLEARERLFVAAGAGVVLLTLVWALLWLPLNRGHEELSRKADEWQRALVSLRPIKAQLEAGGSDDPVRRESSETPIVIIDRTLREHGLAGSLRSSQPTTSNGIRVEFENVAFDDLVVWLGGLSSEYGLEVQAGSLSTGTRNGPGRINASLTLERLL